MAKQKFGALLAEKAEKGTTAGAELRKLETKDTFDYQVIPYEKIFTNSLNDYPITEIEKLAASIERNGLFHPLGLIPVEIEGETKYKLLDGERRYTAIGKLLEEGNTKFKIGVPSKIFESSLNDIDQEIILREANELVRDTDPVRKRKNIERLSELYKIRNKINGTNDNVNREIANVTGIGIRQVQRYEAVNSGLIEELKDALDSGKITLENAAKFSKLEIEAQKDIANIIKSQESITKEEYLFIKEESEKREKEYNEKLRIIEEQRKIDEKKLKSSEKEKIKLENLLKAKEEEEKEKEENENKKLEELKEKLKKEYEALSPDKEKIEEYEKLIKVVTDTKEKLQREKEEIQKKLEFQEKENKKLKDEISNKNKVLRPAITPEEQEKLRAEFEIKNIMSEIKKEVNQLIVKSQKYEEKYNIYNTEVDDFIKEIASRVKDKGKADMA